MLEHADEIKGKLGERVREFSQQALLSRKLVTIDTNVPLDWSLDDLAVKEPVYSDLEKVLKELEFTRLLSSFAPKEPPSEVKYGLIMDDAALEKAVEWFRGNGYC